jgi:prevent-host-death family protein
MQRAAVSARKASLSGYLKRVKVGEEVIVTERGRPIARLVPYTQASATPNDADELAELERAGILRRPRRALPADFWDQPLVPNPGDAVLKALLADREEGW